ncbi:unnamed protein product [Prunus armeniaca]|uniref:tRNA(adenine(34)) deaminase n=1 Tax=Prunus armeniaca TaxID=36596 RepID=A0A6J5W1T3_PRUAR|nr:unnamed protein product [Prunus armeniaca]
MQNTYFSSSMYSVRTQGSLSYSFNDYSYLLNERFDRNPIHSSTLSSSKSCCCTCCAFSTHRVPINPCYLYGLRQSTLLQWSACRRLILGGRDRYNYRVQEQSPDWGCYELPCSLMEGSVYSRRGRRRKGRCCCMADGEGKGELYNSGDPDDAEAMLSLLSEEVGEECFRRERNGFSFKIVELEGRRRLSGRERNVSSSKRVEEESKRSLSGSERKVNSSKRVEEESRRSLSGRERNAISSKRVEEESRRSLSGSERKVNSSKRLEVDSRRSLSGRERNAISSKRVEAERSFSGREKNGSSSKGVQVEIEGNNSSECNSGKKKNDGRLSSSESNSKRQFESATIDLSEGDSRQKEERGMFLRSENLRGRKGGSSSSYYSFSSSGDFEIDFQDKHGLLEEPASSVYKDSECDRFDEQVSEEYRKHRDDSDGNGEITRQTNTAVVGGVMWDWRKKTEKKLTEVVAEETQADWKSSEMHSKVMKTKQHELGKTSGSHKQFDDEQETSYLTKGTNEQYSQTENQVGGVPESRRKFQEHNEISEIRRNSVETTSWSQKRPTQRENLGIATNLVQETKDEHYKTAGIINQKDDLNRDNQKLSRVSQVRVADAERTSNWQGQSDTRRIYQEENTNMLLSSVNQIEVQHHQIDQQIIGRVNLGRKPQQVTEISEICDSGVETANIIQPEIRIMNQAERSNFVPASSGESSEPYSGMDEKAFQRIQSRKGTDDVTEMPLVRASNKERNNNAQRISKKRTINQGSDIASAATSFEETRQRNNETDETLMQVKPRKEDQSSTGLSNFYEKDSEGASSFQASLSTVSQARIQPHDVVGNKRSLQAMLLAPPSQLIARGSPHIESTSGMATQEVSGEISESGSPAMCTHSGKQTSALHQESYTGSGNAETEAEIEYLIPEDALGSAYRLEKSSSQFLGDFIESVRYGVSTSENQDETVSEPRLVYGGEEDGQGTSALLQESGSGNGNPGTPGEILYLINPEDALNSAHRLEKSSSQFVGEFSEKVRHEVSTSKYQNVNTVSEEKLVHGDEKYGQRNSSQNGSQDLQKKENDSRRSSGGSGTKGPSDEMWDVTDPSVLRTPMAEKSEVATTSGNAIVKRTGRSVWNIVADILRLRWSSNAETPRSAGKSGGRISSNESASSEAWFSGREPEDNNEKNAKRDQDMQPEPTSDQLQPGKSFSQSEGGVSGIMRTKDKVRYPEAGTPSSPIKDDSGLTSKAASVSSGEETLGSKENQKSSQGSSSGIKKVESLQPLIASGVRSPVVEEISNPGITVSASGSTKHMDQFGSQKLNEVSDNVQMGGELKQRKLQRNKQVLRDRFDEWEDAYTLEIEQRKTDEMFMREALLEAKKAADTWEVPVGAVLVQHGKIIARGCNLVEELRDSTAHAEMICIREASNLLRTWRLADSTLYVTLEPCPMCAGAILQARIDTVVWGAPNKLLGADGSWIRLFPDGRGGNGSEQSDKPAAPVHPFHPKMNIRRGVLASECADIMKQFFQLRRKKKEKQADPPAPPARQPVSHHPSKLLTKFKTDNLIINVQISVEVLSVP